MAKKKKYYFPGYKAEKEVLRHLRGGKQCADGVEVVAASEKDAWDKLYYARVKAAEDILPGAGKLVRRR